jgi:hypothetical protein
LILLLKGLVSNLAISASNTPSVDAIPASGVLFGTRWSRYQVQLVNPRAPEHATSIAKILDLARWPHHCTVTRRAMEDMVRARITKEAVLESIRDHIQKGKPIYFLIQESTNSPGYVFLPCNVDGCELYVKVQLSAAKAEKEEHLIVISSHPPAYAPSGANK